MEINPACRVIWQEKSWYLEGNTVTNGNETLRMEDGPFDRLLVLADNLVIIKDNEIKYRVNSVAGHYILHRLTALEVNSVFSDLVREFFLGLVTRLQERELYDGFSSAPITVESTDSGISIIGESVNSNFSFLVNKEINFSISESQGVIWLNEIPIMVGGRIDARKCMVGC